MPELARPDVTLHYEIDGNGPPLLLLAGMMSDSASFAPILPLLTPHLTVIRPDNRTTGRTVPALAETTPALWAADARALIDHLGFDEVHLAGHSLGGAIAWHIAHDAPDRIASCTMIASAPVLLARNVMLFRTLVDVRTCGASPDLWLRLLYPWLFGPDFFERDGAVEVALAEALAYPYGQSPQAMAHQIDALLRADPAVFRDTPPVPMLALLAERDLLVPLETAREALDDMPVEILRGLAHAAHWEAPEVVAHRLLAHVRQHTAGVA